MKIETYFEANRRRWDESVGIHIRSSTGFYRTEAFLDGADILLPIEDAEVGEVSGKRLLHLQCHFGLDTLSLARRGAMVTGLDFSSEAIKAADSLSAQSGVSGRFITGNVYDARRLVEGHFEVVYVTWGSINWLPDIRRWARVVADLLVPGGHLYLLEGHPVALTLEQSDHGDLTPTYDYFQGADPLESDEETTYTGDSVRLRNARSYEWIHSLSDILNALSDAGLSLEFLNEHDRLAWPLFSSMVSCGDGMYRMPSGHASIPLAFSLMASRIIDRETGGPNSGRRRSTARP